MVYLGELSHGRNNNLNLIRMVAAIGVLVSHAWPIALGPQAVQPLYLSTGFTLGEVCVYVFFGISGFLIAGSFLNARSLLHFSLARILRLFPALVVSLVVVAFVMAPPVTSLPLAAYLSNPETWSFLVRNTFLAFPQFTLPGVFDHNPYPTVEGSIWTLIHEAMCYLGIFLAGVVGLLARRTAATLAIVAYVILGQSAAVLHVIPHPRLESFQTLSMVFAIGTLLYLWRAIVPMTWMLGAALALVAVLLHGTPVYETAFVLALIYWVFWLAYVPGGVLRRYNRIGDYSYGTYIYAFPAQGLAVWLVGPMTPVENILIALPITLIPSILSWHLIEQPALRSKNRLAELFARQRAPRSERA